MASPVTQKGLLILDRDGVINHDSSAFVKSADEWRPLPGSLTAIGSLTKSGYTVTVASNQSGLARGLFERSALNAIHRKMRRLAASEGGRIARIVVCPHGPTNDCRCRKPKPGLLQRLAKHYGVSLVGVPVVGDSLRDLVAAEAVGARPILVLTGNGKKTAATLPPSLKNIEVYADLSVATRVLVR